MHPREQLAVIRRGWPLVVAATVLAAVVAFLVTSSMPKVYEAQAKLIVGQSLNSPTPDINVIMASQRLSQTYAELVTTRPIVTRVIDTLDLPDDPDQLKSRIIAEAPGNSLYVTILAQDASPEGAARIANELAAELIKAAPAIVVTAPGEQPPRLLTVVEPAIPDSSPVVASRAVDDLSGCTRGRSRRDRARRRS